MDREEVKARLDSMQRMLETLSRKISDLPRSPSLPRAIMRNANVDEGADGQKSGDVNDRLQREPENPMEMVPMDTRRVVENSLPNQSVRASPIWHKVNTEHSTGEKDTRATLRRRVVLGANH